MDNRKNRALTQEIGRERCDRWRKLWQIKETALRREGKLAIIQQIQAGL